MPNLQESELLRREMCGAGMGRKHGGSGVAVGESQYWYLGKSPNFSVGPGSARKRRIAVLYKVNIFARLFSSHEREVGAGGRSSRSRRRRAGPRRAGGVGGGQRWRRRGRRGENDMEWPLVVFIEAQLSFGLKHWTHKLKLLQRPRAITRDAVLVGEERR